VLWLLWCANLHSLAPRWAERWWVSFGSREVVRTRALLNFLAARVKMGWLYYLPCLVINMVVPIGPRSSFVNGIFDEVVIFSFWVSSCLWSQEYVMVPIVFSGICCMPLSLDFLAVEIGSLRSQAHYLYPWFPGVHYSRGNLVMMGFLV